MGPKEAKTMKKVLWSIAVATLILTLAGCSNGVPLNIGDKLTQRDEGFWDNYPSSYNKNDHAR